MKRLQQEELEQQQKEQQIPSAPTLPPSDSEFYLASESTVAAATYEAPQDEPSSSALNIDFLHLPASPQLPNDVGHPHLGWAEPGDDASESWNTVDTRATSDIPDRPSLNSASSGWGGISSDNWSDNATESNGGEERTVKARRGSGSISGAIEMSGEELHLQRASQGIEVHSSVDILAEPDNKLYFSQPTLSSQPSQPPPQPHFRSSSLSSHISPQSPVSSSLPQICQPSVQQSPSAVYSRSSAPPPPPVELTPGIIAKAQKHCRFAVSALNYDDVEQAKKELRDALALLGG